MNEHPGNGTGESEGGRREGRWKKEGRKRWRRLHRTTGWPTQDTGKKKWLLFALRKI